MGVPFLLYFNIAFIMSEYNIDKINNPNSTSQLLNLKRKHLAWLSHVQLGLNQK